MIKHYVEYIYPGLMVSETSTEIIEERNPDKIKLPEHSYGFRFFDREEIEENAKILKGDAKKYSHWYFQGVALTTKDVLKNHPGELILISNMRINNISRVCRTQFGQAIPMDDDDTIIVERKEE